MLRRVLSIAAFIIVFVLSASSLTLHAQEVAADQAQNGRDALALPVVPIAQALEDHNGDTIPDRLLQAVHVRGVVTIGSGVIADDRTQIYIQDSTGGVYLYSSRPRTPRVNAGDVLDVGGIVNQYRGSVELLRPAYAIVGRAPLPAAIATTLADAATWRYYGRRIKVEGTISGEQNRGEDLVLVLRERSNEVDVIIPPKTLRALREADLHGGLHLSDLRRGTRITAAGVSSIYSVDRPYRQGFEVIVARAEDVTIVRPPAPAWVRPAITWGVAGLIAIAIAIAAVMLITRTARHRRRDLEVLSEVSSTVARAGADLPSLIAEAIEVMSRHRLIDGAIVHLVEGTELHMSGSFGVDERTAHEVDQQVRLQIPASLVRTEQTEIRLPSLHPLVCVPLHARSRTVGVLTAFASKRHTLTPREASTIASVANVMALGIENIEVLRDAEATQNELKQLAITDPLTGLYNRRFLDEYLRIHIPMARRQSAPVAFIAIDLDHFKSINDTCGHDAGDVLLREFGATMRRLTRASDLPVRLGGEEFLVVMPDTSEAGAVAFAQRLQEELKRADFSQAGVRAGFRLTASFGIALYPDHGEQVAPLLRTVDEALYESKRAGRDRVTVAPMPFRLVEA